MYSKIPNRRLVNPAEMSQGLTHVKAGLTRLPAGLRVKTHIKAGPTKGCGPCHQS
jgi:hypothetical protein